MTRNEEAVAFYFQLGLTLTYWSEIEQSLSALAAACVSIDHEPALRDGFYAIENFRSKCTYADALFTNQFTNAVLVSRWRKLLNKIESAARIRNKFAHHVAREYYGGASGRRFALIGWREDFCGTKRQGDISFASHSKPPNDAICVRDIWRINNEWQALRISMENFRFHLLNSEEPYPKSDEQPQNPPTIREIAARTHELLSLQQQSFPQ